MYQLMNLTAMNLIYYFFLLVTYLQMSVHTSISIFNWAEARIPFLNSLQVQQLLLRGILSSLSRLGDPVMVPVSPGYVPFNKRRLFFHVPEDLLCTGVKHLLPSFPLNTVCIFWLFASGQQQK